MARVRKTLADRNGQAFDVAFQEVLVGDDTALAPVHVVEDAGSGSALDLQGVSTSLPEPDSVPVHSTFFALDTGELLWTDGTQWQAVGVGSGSS